MDFRVTAMLQMQLRAGKLSANAAWVRGAAQWLWGW